MNTQKEVDSISGKLAEKRTLENMANKKNMRNSECVHKEITQTCCEFDDLCACFYEIKPISRQFYLDFFASSFTSETKPFSLSLTLLPSISYSAIPFSRCTFTLCVFCKSKRVLLCLAWHAITSADKTKS